MSTTEAKASDVKTVVNTGASSNTQTKTNLEFSRQNMQVTDKGCLGCFFLYFLGMLIVMAVSMQTGNPMRLIYGTDYMGGTCATGPNEGSVATELEKISAKPKDAGVFWQEDSWNNYYKNRKDITYPRTNIDQLVNKLVGTNVEVDYPTLPNFYGLCTSKCPVAREEEHKGRKVTLDDLSKIHYNDVVCSIQASKAIQDMCIDTSFTSNLNNSVFDRLRSEPYTPAATRNTWNEYQGNLADLTSANTTIIDFGTLMSPDKEDGARQYLLPWAPITMPADGESGTDQEGKCLTQFFDRCHGGGAAEERCRSAGASDAAIAAVNNDCWKQRVNSISVVNRCVASRNVKLQTICRDPAETVRKICIDQANKILPETTDASCRFVHNATLGINLPRRVEYAPKKFSRPQFVCVGRNYDNTASGTSAYPYVEVPANREQCWANKGCVFFDSCSVILAFY